MEATIFYILGIGLVVIALVLSAVGLRWPEFPPTRGVMVAITVGVIALVGGTATFAWINAEEEQSEHAAELAQERAEAAEEAAAEQVAAQGPAEDQTGDGADADAEPAGDGAAASAEGAAVFDSAGCSGCHTLRAAGSTAQTGPDLDGALRGRSRQYIETAIVDPSAQIAEGFPPNVMPDNFGSTLTPEELNALVDYLHESVR